MMPGLLLISVTSRWCARAVRAALVLKQDGSALNARQTESKSASHQHFLLVSLFIYAIVLEKAVVMAVC